MTYGTTETLTEPRTVDGNDLAKMVLEILTAHVGAMPAGMQAAVAHHRKFADKIVQLGRETNNAAPLLGMLLASLTELCNDDNVAPGAMH